MTRRHLARPAVPELLVAAGLSALLVGCAAAQPTPHPIATLDLSTVSFPPSPSPTATPATELARRAFVAFGASSSASYHLTFSGKVNASVSKLTVTGSVDVSGLDVATSTRYVFDNGARGTVDSRWVKRAAFVRLDGGAWHKTTFDPRQVVAPLAGIDERGAVTSVVATNGANPPRYTIVVSAGRLIDLTTIPAYNLTDEGVTYATWTLVTDSKGHPISGTWKLTGKGRVSGQLQEIVVDLKVTFSKVGSKIAIKAP